MEIRLSEYSNLVVDASFFKAVFPSDLVSQLKGMRLFVPSTFFVELEQYRRLLPRKKRDILDQNLAAINLARVDNTEIRGDIWSVVNKLSGKNTLILTSNRILIQRIVLRNISVDILELEKFTILSAVQFESCRNEYGFLPMEEDPEPENVVLKDELTLYTDINRPLQLKKTDMDGAESVIYSVENDKTLIAKVILPESMRTEKIRNILWLCELRKELDCIWIMLPEQLLYWDPECKKLAGFLQIYQDKANTISSEKYYGNPQEEDLDTKISESVDICLQIVRQIALLNTYGIYVSDFNLSNFAKVPDHPDYIYMWDTDSFCSRYYRPYSYRDLVTFRMACPDSNADAIDWCNEMLYVCVFMILSLGYPPLNASDCSYMFSQLSENEKWREHIFQDKLRNLFFKVFDKNSRITPPIDALMYELERVSQLLQRDPEKDLTYRQIWESNLNQQEETADSDPPEAEDTANAENKKTTIAENKPVRNTLGPTILMGVSPPTPLAGPLSREKKKPVPILRGRYTHIITRPAKRNSINVPNRRIRINLKPYLRVASLFAAAGLGSSILIQIVGLPRLEMVIRSAWSGFQALMEFCILG